jgi:hypothetical protein
VTELIGEIEVETVCPLDTNIWQTSALVEGYWHVVETYYDEREATEGHKSWVQKITDDPTQELPDCSNMRYR